MNNQDNRRLPALRSEGTEAEESPEFRCLAGQAFRTRDGRGFIEIDVPRRRDIVPIQGKAFRQWLLLRLREKTGKLPSAATLSLWINLLEAHALHNAPEADVHVRVACVILDAHRNCVSAPPRCGTGLSGQVHFAHVQDQALQQCRVAAG